MGITIFYKGNFRSDQSMSKMIDEAVVFANKNNWTYYVFNREFPKESEIIDKKMKYGILLSPPDCESIHLYFNGRRQLGFESDLRDLITENWVGNSAENGHWERELLPPDYQPTWGAFTKTQYAGAAIHSRVVNVLKQLSETYFSDFVVNDEAEFWDHGNYKMLKHRFGEVAAGNL